jgi:ABC-type lipoprotein export system ATPase subunit
MTQNSTKRIINLCGVSKVYPDGDSFCEVLNEIDLEIFAGESLSIVGQSGSGKTTLLQIICFMQNLSSGTYLFEESNTSSFNNEDKARILKNKIGIVYQQHNLLNEFSVYENILLCLGNLKPSKQQNDFIDTILQNFGIYQKKHSRPKQLSGGQAQRASIARAICKKPQLLLLDEPTGNLDEFTSIDVMKTIKKTCDEFNIAMLLITHNNNLTSYTTKTYQINNKKLTRVL